MRNLDGTRCFYFASPPEQARLTIVKICRLNLFAKIWASLFLMTVLFIGQQTRAQNLTLSVTTSTNLLVGTNTLTYGINLTNQTGLLFTNVIVTNLFSDPITLIEATNSLGGGTTTSNAFLFTVGRMTNGAFAHMGLTIQAINAGFLTNTITAKSSERTNTVSTNIVTLAATAVSDLALFLTPPKQAVITNDFISFSLIVSNLGESTVPNVYVVQSVPTNAIIRSVSPSFTIVSNSLVFTLGTLNGSNSASIQFSVQPTNVGAINLSAYVNASGFVDTFVTNNFLNTNIPVIAYLPGTLLAVTNSAQTLNRQSGLTEQIIRLTNIGTTDVPAARLVLTDLPSNKRLFNAVGTNNSNPFVYYSAPIAAGAQTTLLLEYEPRGDFAFTNSQLHAFPVPLPDWTPPKASRFTNSLNIRRILRLANGNWMIEFPSIEGAAYSIVYSSDASFSDAKIAPPSIVAPANVMQWIDYGPPATVTASSNAPARFYRVFQSP